MENEGRPKLVARGIGGATQLVLGDRVLLESSEDLLPVPDGQCVELISGDLAASELSAAYAILVRLVQYQERFAWLAHEPGFMPGNGHYSDLAMAVVEDARKLLGLPPAKEKQKAAYEKRFDNETEARAEFFSLPGSELRADS